MDLESRAVSHHTALCRAHSRTEEVKSRPQSTVFMTAVSLLGGNLYCGGHSTFITVATGSASRQPQAVGVC